VLIQTRGGHTRTLEFATDACWFKHEVITHELLSLQPTRVDSNTRWSHTNSWVCNRRVLIQTRGDHTRTLEFATDPYWFNSNTRWSYTNSWVNNPLILIQTRGDHTRTLEFTTDPCWFKHEVIIHQLLSLQPTRVDSNTRWSNTNSWIRNRLVSNTRWSHTNSWVRNRPVLIQPRGDQTRTLEFAIDPCSFKHDVITHELSIQVQTLYLGSHALSMFQVQAIYPGSDLYLGSHALSMIQVQALYPGSNALPRFMRFIQVHALYLWFRFMRFIQVHELYPGSRALSMIQVQALYPGACAISMIQVQALIQVQ